MKFFLPAAENASAEELEKFYGELAAFANRGPAPAGKRIYRITFVHDGEYWTAEVGKPLSGMRVETKRRKGGKVTVKTPLSDDATVLAIFAGAPYFVVTNARPITRIGSHWVNPFMAGQPESVQYFED